MRTYRDTHPWITFNVDLDQVPRSAWSDVRVSKEHRGRFNAGSNGGMAGVNHSSAVCFMRSTF